MYVVVSPAKNLASLKSEDVTAHLPTLREVFRPIGQCELPADGDLSQLPPAKEMIALALLWEISMPVRIVFGYDGYASERTLRTGFLDYLEQVSEKGPQQGFGPPSLPSLIICGTNSLVKQNGMPFSANTDRPDQWLAYSSAHEGAIALLIEVIWTRLCVRGLVSPEIFGKDLQVEQLTPLLFAKAVVGERGEGWQYIAHEPSAKDLAAVPSTRAWEPVFITDDEKILLDYRAGLPSSTRNPTNFGRPGRRPWVTGLRGRWRN